MTFFYLKDGPLLWSTVVRQGGNRARTMDQMGGAMWDKLHGFVRGTGMFLAVPVIAAMTAVARELQTTTPPRR